MDKPAPPLADVAAFLASHHDRSVAQLEPLPGGFWSQAYAYELDGREMVLRLGHDDAGYRLDRAAMRYAGPGLPIPEILSIGEAVGHAYAISLRHHGRFLEDVSVDEAATVGPALVELLDALRVAPKHAPAPSDDRFEPSAGWRGWLVAAMADDPTARTAGWRKGLAADARASGLFDECERRIGSLLDACPERRDLVHSDLLHQNVLVSDDASEVTAVFSWKCATLGDFLYDTAWCTFWGAWHPGIGAADIWTRMTTPREGIDEADLVDAAQRHHCYELQIGAHHLGWYVWTEDADNLRWCADRLDEILQRGPWTS